MRPVSFIFILFLGFQFSNCAQKKENAPLPVENKPTYSYLPENLVARDEAQGITAQYVDTTLRYSHGILGDNIEAGGLLVTKKGVDFYYQLDAASVFEDLQPRLKDLDNDGELEFLTIQSSLTEGASVAIFKIIDNKLQLYAKSAFIGTPYRWLNIVAMDDLDNDGKTEIAWIQTPHIGGVLRIGRIEKNILTVIDEKSGVSNHRIGSRNLCLSVVTQTSGQKKIFVPNNAFNALVGFTFQNNKIIFTDTIPLTINSSVPLFQQYNFRDVVADKNCIFK